MTEICKREFETSNQLTNGHSVYTLNVHVFG